MSRQTPLFTYTTRSSNQILSRWAFVDGRSPLSRELGHANLELIRKARSRSNLLQIRSPELFLGKFQRELLLGLANLQKTEAKGESHAPLHRSGEARVIEAATAFSTEYLIERLNDHHVCLLIGLRLGCFHCQPFADTSIKSLSICNHSAHDTGSRVSKVAGRLTQHHRWVIVFQMDPSESQMKITVQLSVTLLSRSMFDKEPLEVHSKYILGKRMAAKSIKKLKKIA